MRDKCKYTENELIEAIRDSISLRQAMISLGIKPEGGNYKVIKRKIRLLDIDTSHMLGKGFLKGKKHNWNPITPLKDILVKDSTYGGTGNQLKKKLFDAGLFERKCYKCNLMYWLDKPIALELEHINGDNCDNRIHNLTILCPNCHAQTDTYRKRKYL